MTNEEHRTLLRRLEHRIRVRIRIALTKRRLQSGLPFDELFAIAANHFGILQKQSEIRALCELVAAASPSAICELGSHKGGTSFLFARNFNTAAKILLVDRSIENAALQRYYNGSRANLHFIEGDSCSPDVLGRVDDILAGHPLDFLFIDGDHSYDGVTRDLFAYYDRVRDGGYIAFHDIAPDYRTLYNESNNTWSGDVYKVWTIIKDFFESYEFIEQTGQDGFGIGVLVKKDSMTTADLSQVLARGVQEKLSGRGQHGQIRPGEFPVEG